MPITSRAGFAKPAIYDAPSGRLAFVAPQARAKPLLEDGAPSGLTLSLTSRAGDAKPAGYDAPSERGILLAPAARATPMLRDAAPPGLACNILVFREGFALPAFDVAPMGLTCSFFNIAGRRC